MFTKCACSDPQCPAHKGKDECRRHAEIIVYRIDMTDRTGTAVCGHCAEDALSSGVFTTLQETKDKVTP